MSMMEQTGPDLPDLSQDETVKAWLKWFNSPKGFGFVVPENAGIDAFLHVTTLQRAGVDALGENACLLCRIKKGPRGAQVSEIVAMLDPGAKPASVRPKPKNEIYELNGFVKWYRPDKGFGFVEASDGQKDVFLHKSLLQKHGLTSLEPGTPVVMIVKAVSKGREAIDFTILED